MANTITSFKSSGSPSWQNRYNRFRQQAEPYLFVGPAIILLILLLLIPIGKVIQDSFFDNSFIQPDAPYIGTENYTDIIGKEIFVKSIRNSIVFTVFSVASHLIIGIALALLLNRPLKRWILSIFRATFILPWIFTAAVVAVAWNLILTPLGIFNYILGFITQTKVTIDWLGNPNLAMVSLIFINAWRGFPFVMISVLAGLQSIDGELYEASAIDGAGSVKSFRYITLPLLKPILLALSLLDAIWTLNLFPLIWLTTGGGPSGATETIATLTYKLAFNQFEFGQASAMGVIAVLLTMIVTIFYLRYQRMT